MKTFYSLLCSIFFSLCINAQQRKVYSNLPLRTEEHKEIFSLWNNYLQSNTNYADSFWCSKAIKKYAGTDVLKNAIGLNGSLYDIFFECNVLGIYKFGNKNLIKSAFYWNNGKSNDSITFMALVNVIVVKENGIYKLDNYLDYSTSSWHEQIIGKIKYHFPNNYPFNTNNASKANLFLDSISKWFHVPKVDTINYYIPNNCTDGYKMVGFEYFEGEARELNLCGFFDNKNNILYSNSKAGEFYAHELIHIINKEYPNANFYLKTGLASYINDAGSLGISIKDHVKKYVSMSPDYKTMEEFYNIDYIDDITSPNYIFGATICHAILRRGGLKLLIQTMNIKFTKKEFNAYLLKICGYRDMGEFFKEEFQNIINEDIILKI